MIEIIAYYGFGLILLFLTITFAVQIGIDTSKQAKAIRSELKEIKKQIKNIQEEKV